MKLTAASLAAQSSDAFDGSPEVAGELEGWVRYVLTKEGNTLLVADTKEDGEQKAKCARFNFDKLPDGCGRGAKVKLGGIQFVRKVGRDYNGKTYYDMVYSFAACEVLEAGAARGGFGGKPGGGWQPRSPEERASIEAQNIMTSSVQFGVATFNQASLAGADKPLDIALSATETAFDRLWAKLQSAKRAAAAAQPAQPSTAAGQPAANGAPSGANTANGGKTTPAGNQGRFPASLSEAGQELAKKIGALVVEMFGQDEAPVALEHLTAWIGESGEERPGIKSVTAISNERQAKAIMVGVGQLHHWWKTANVTDRALLADIVLKQGTSVEARLEDIKALQDAGAKSSSQSPEFDVLGPYPMDATEWSGFLKLVRDACGAKDDDAAVAAVEKTASGLFGDAYKPLKAKFLTEDAMNAVVKKLREE